MELSSSSLSERSGSAPQVLITGDPLIVRCGGLAVPPLSGVGKENEIVAHESLGGGAYGSAAWSELEEDEGATLSFVNVVTQDRGRGGSGSGGQAPRPIKRSLGIAGSTGGRSEAGNDSRL
jgi:hypothetical protein